MSYMQGDIICPLMKGTVTMPAQWCTSSSSGTEESMPIAYPALQVRKHIHVLFINILFSPQSVISASISLLQYISQSIALYLFFIDLTLHRSSIRLKPPLCLQSSYSVRRMDYDV